MNKKYLALFALLSFAGTACAQEWIDVTDSYIQNPRYDGNNYSGWLGTKLSYANPKENAEHYGKTYDTYQILSGLPAGRFRLSLNAFYRIGDQTTDYTVYKDGSYKDYQIARLYATSSIDTYDVGIAPLASGAVKNGLGGTSVGVGNVVSSGGGWWGGWQTYEYYVPNDMEAAYYWFNAGYYKNSVDCKVGDDGELRIGIKKDYVISSDWTCIDNWKLEYYGSVKHVTGIGISKKTADMVVSEEMYLSCNVSPSDATYRNAKWSSTNNKVATVDSKGKVTAVGIGTCFIKAASVDNSAITATCKITVSTNTPTSENIVINEIMASNVDTYRDPSTNFGSWVELYNPTDKGVILGGLYVTDDPADLKKHKLVDDYGALPAKGFALLNFDHYEVWTKMSYRQIDDKLDCDGGVIIISDGKKILAQQEYPAAISRCSYARTTDGGAEWAVTGNPSAGLSNQAEGGFASEQLPAPVVDKDAQLFKGTLQICVSIPEGATLKYTTDGTAPSLTNGETSKTGIFVIDYNTCFRFRTFKDGYLPSPVVTRTYIYNSNFPFPIISVVTDANNLDDNNLGLFKQGEFGRPGNGQTSNCNWNMSWDRPVNFEFITLDNECIVSQECDMSTCGGWSRAWQPHSFKLKATKVYDFKNTFDAKLFEEKPNLKFKTLQIRNGGNDNNCRIKDPALQQIVARSGLYVDYQAWQPVHVFFNGQHYAVLNMREANNKHYAYSNYGIDTDEMDQFEMSPDSGYVQMEGTDESYLRLLELSENAADDDTYNEIAQLLDIDEYINYMAVQMYIGNWDWPQNNVKGFRDVNDGKFHFVLFDLDGALSTSTPFSTFFGKENYTFDTLHGYDHSLGKSVEGSRRYRQIKFVTLFKNMLKNETFRRRFIDTYCIVGGSVFDNAHVKSIVSDVANYLGTDNYVYPSNTANTLISSFNSSYNSNLVNQLKSCSYMKLSSKTRQALTLDANVDDAKIMINDVEVPYSKFNGYIFPPVTVKAVAPAGYRFVGWTSLSGSSSEKIVFSEGTNWKFYDSGSLDNTKWYSSSYSDSSWKNGSAPLGYGKDQKTVLKANLSCYYFRKTFTLSNTPSAKDVYNLDITIDDGMIVYVNGKEVGRYNMPSGNVAYNDVATTYANNNPDNTTLQIPASLLQKGTNVIAVEVHNNNTTSSDILWNASLTASIASIDASNVTDYISNEEEYEVPSSGKRSLSAIFEPIAEDELIASGYSPIRINEVSASNSMYVNDYYKKVDWIELYNASDEDIDIAGMYISDNMEKLQKYQVPTDDVRLNTVIKAHGYKVIWCDKNDIIGSDIHTSFKLAAEGGDVVITTDDFTDSIKYTGHTNMQTFGRYPDGADETYLMNIPTIGKSNLLGSFDTPYTDDDLDLDPTPDGINGFVKEGGITIAYARGVVNVKSEDSDIISFNVYSTSGAKVGNKAMVRWDNKFVTVNVDNLPKGVYVANAITASGDEKRIKFVIK